MSAVPPPPPQLHDLRAEGLIFVDVTCCDPACQHDSRLEIDMVPDQLTVAALQQSLRCSACLGRRRRGVVVHPRWPDRMGQIARYPVGRP